MLAIRISNVNAFVGKENRRAKVVVRLLDVSFVCLKLVQTAPDFRQVIPDVSMNKRVRSRTDRFFITMNVGRADSVTDLS
jgi:hypothetical protein